MSQTIALIVTASVLLLTASIVTFITKGGLTDFLDGSQKESCISQVKSKCKYGSTGSISTPSSCESLSESVNVQYGDGSAQIDPDSSTVSCNAG